MKTLVGFIALIVSSAALACSCGSWPDGKFMVTGSKAAFIGFPSTDSLASGVLAGEAVQKTTFVVLRNFKSIRYSRTLNVYTTKNTGGNCGVDFTAMTGVYLIFADLVEGKLVTSECGMGNVDDNRAIKALNEITL